MTKTTTLLDNLKADAISYINSVETYIAVSTDSSTPLDSDTTMGGTELREAVFSSSTNSTSVSKTMFLDVTEFNGNTINKAGTYSASSGANLLGSALTNATSKDSSTEVLIEIQTEVEVVNV